MICSGEKLCMCVYRENQRSLLISKDEVFIEFLDAGQERKLNPFPPPPPLNLSVRTGSFPTTMDDDFPPLFECLFGPVRVTHVFLLN